MILRQDSNSPKPIYIQIAEWIEEEILRGTFKKEEKVYSQYKLAEIFTINPATAAKGLTKLAEEGVLYDKRGLGKFVSENAVEIISDKRINQSLKKMIEHIVREAEYLQLSDEELMNMLKRALQQRGGKGNEGD